MCAAIVTATIEVMTSLRFLGSHRPAVET